MERTAKIVSGLEKRAQKGQRIEREGAEKRSKTAEDASIPSGALIISVCLFGRSELIRK